mmetsp:Transcript_7591/g.10772  ORF Transcript_7591/g.10772 Transcript_7591/m.10772 type:complete len:118 (-) Transcript_7591:253-606(-)
MIARRSQGPTELESLLDMQSDEGYWLGNLNDERFTSTIDGGNPIDREVFDELLRMQIDCSPDDAYATLLALFILATRFSYSYSEWYSSSEAAKEWLKRVGVVSYHDLLAAFTLEIIY